MFHGNWYINRSEEEMKEKLREDLKRMFKTEIETMNTEKKIVITTDGKTTTARLFENKKVIKEAEAKCSPEDIFSFETGVKLAIERLFEKKYYCGIIKCVSGSSIFKEGELYRIKDGYFVSENGIKSLTLDTPYESIEQINKTCHAKFREAVPKDYLKTGVFGKSKLFGWFVIVNDNLIFENGGFTEINSYNDKLHCISCRDVYNDSIDIIVKAKSFTSAKSDRSTRCVIWERKDEA